MPLRAFQSTTNHIMPSQFYWINFTLLAAFFILLHWTTSFDIAPSSFRRSFLLEPPAAAFLSAATSNRDRDINEMHFQSYYQLVVNQDGTTSILERKFDNIEEVGYSNTPQLVKKLNTSTFAKPTDVVFTTLQGENPWHYCPSPQLVVCTGGAWFIRTSDGNTTQLPIGSTLYQDNTENHPLAGGQVNESTDNIQKGQHLSGSVNNKPCDQLIIQLALLNDVASVEHKPL